MALLPFTACALLSTLSIANSFAQTTNKQAPIRPTITIVTDPGWEVSSRQTKFGEYPLSADKIASATSSLYGGTSRAVAAAYSDRANQRVEVKVLEKGG